MSLVEYSDSESSNGDVVDTTLVASSHNANLKRKRDSTLTSDLPPLPDTFHDLYASSVRVSTEDDPALHGGRQRVTPHVEGHWPSHVYIEWHPSRTELDVLARLVKDINSGLPNETAKFQSLLESDLGAEMPLHISLSRSMMLLTDQRQPFTDMFTSLLEDVGVRPFELSVTSLRSEPNFEGTRWFLVFQIAKPDGNGLNKLLQVSNTTAARLGQPPLYAIPPEPSVESIFRGMGQRSSRGRTRGATAMRHDAAPRQKQVNVPDMTSHFHISVAWSLEKPPQGLMAQAKPIDVSKLKEIRILVKNVKVKIGNAVSTYPLLAKVMDAKSIIGS